MVRVRAGNGLLQSLGAWIVQGLVLGAGLFPHGFAHRGAKSWSKGLDRFSMYGKAYYTRGKGLEASRTIFQKMLLMMGVRGWDPWTTLRTHTRP